MDVFIYFFFERPVVTMETQLMLCVGLTTATLPSTVVSFDCLWTGSRSPSSERDACGGRLGNTGS